MSLKDRRVCIVGGGIGGAAAAVALAHRGAHVTLHERASGFEEVGAGLQISTNGQRVLNALGVVGPAAPDFVTVSQGTQMRSVSGRLITTIPAPSAGATWYVHRADLLKELVQSAEAAGVHFVLGRELRPDDMPEADVIVAADGGQSAWREQIDGPVQSSFTGQVAWRALVPKPMDPSCAVACLSMGPGAHVVKYGLRGGQVTNIVAVEERADWTQEGWRIAGDPDDMRRRFSAFGGVVAPLFENVRDVHVWALHLRPVAEKWWRDKAVLLGDAAHPTLPFMAQGACLALEDAWVLAACLDCHAEVEEALRRYQTLRQPRAQRVVALAKGNAWRFHLRKPWAWGAQAVLAVAGQSLARKLEWVYDFDATASDIQINPDRHMV